MSAIISEEMRRYLHDELFSMTLMATVQRGRVYAPGSTSLQKEGFQRSLRQQLERLAAQYSRAVSETDHISNIESLSDSLSRLHSDALCQRRFRIGSAQKALNLFLKYLWCIGEIGAPPHCPFDRRIIEMLPRDRRHNWTEIDDVRDYEVIVGAAKELSGALPLAHWELQEYNKGGS